MQQSARPVSAKEIDQTQLHLGQNFQVGKRCLLVRISATRSKRGFQLGQVRCFAKFYPGSRATGTTRPRENALSSSPEVRARPRLSTPLPGAQDPAMPDAGKATVGRAARAGRSDPPSCSLRKPSAAASFKRKKWKFTMHRAPSNPATSFGSESCEAMFSASPERLAAPAHTRRRRRGPARG